MCIYIYIYIHSYTSRLYHIILDGLTLYGIILCYVISHCIRYKDAPAVQEDIVTNLAGREDRETNDPLFREGGLGACIHLGPWTPACNGGSGIQMSSSG